jgi:hypothetical protein
VKRELENSWDVLLNAQIEIYDVDQTCLSEIWSEELSALFMAYLSAMSSMLHPGDDDIQVSSL